VDDRVRRWLFVDRPCLRDVDLPQTRLRLVASLQAKRYRRTNTQLFGGIVRGEMKALDAANDLDSLLAHKEWLARLAQHLVHGDLAEDVAQETWVAALRSPPEPGRPPRPWLAEVLRNFIRKQARTDVRRTGREVTSQGGTAASVNATPEELYQRVELQRRLVERVMELGEPERRIVLMRYFDDRSATEIAQSLGIPAGTVRWRLKEALDHLRQQLDGEHDGDRRAWQTLLLPLGGGAPPVPRGVAGLGKAKAVTKAGGVAVLAGLVVGVVILAKRPEPSRTTTVARAAFATSRGTLRVFGGRDESASLGSIGGTVRDPSGKVVADAIVTAMRVEPTGTQPAPSVVPLSSTSDARGAFTLSLPAGDYRLSANARGFSPAKTAKAIVLEKAAAADVVLELAVEGFSFFGRVHDSGGGVIPHGELRVRLPGGGWAIARGDQSGVVGIHLASGDYNFEVDADGYAPFRSAVSLLGDLERSFQLGPAGRISGRVLAGEAPAAGAIVRADVIGNNGSADVVAADDEGRFAFADLNPGQYQVSAAKGGAVGYIAAPLAVQATGVVENVVVTLAPAYSISGRVIDEAGKPVSAAKVCMEEAVKLNQGQAFCRPIATTDDGGHYAIEGVSPGRFRVGAQATPHAPSEIADVLVKDRSISDLTLKLSVGGVVTGVVRDSGGTPAGGVRVNASVRDSDSMDAVYRGTGSADTGADGRYRIAGLGAGVLSMSADHRLFGTSALVSQLARGETKTLDLQFDSGAFAAGTVHWDDETPAAAMRVRWVPFGRNDGAARLAMTDQEGRFRLGPVTASDGMVQAELPAANVIRVGGPSWMPYLKRVTLKPGQTEAGITLILAKPDQTIKGVVVGPDGAPLADARVEASSLSSLGGRRHRFLSQGQVGVSSATGVFQVTELPKGTYVLAVSHPLFPTAERSGVSAGSLNVRLQVSAGATIAGVAIDEREQPMGHYTAVVLPAESAGAHNGHGTGQDVGLKQVVRDARAGFSFDRVAAGRYDVLVTTVDGRAGRLAGVSLGSGDVRRDLRVRVGQSVTLTGRVVAYDSGAALPNVGVTILGTREHVHARTDAEGRFAIEGLVGGRTLVISSRGADAYISERREVTLPEGVARFEMPPFRLLPTSIIRKGDNGGHAGFGIWSRGAPATIERVLADSPAGRAGVRAGDLLRSVDGTDVSDWGGDAINAVLVGTEGSQVTLVVESIGTRKTLSLTRVRIEGFIE
jgi:RNA polymerase sigma-70 factor (ECF subfamily)